MKIKIIKKDDLKDSHYLKVFYSYLEEKKIEIVYKTEVLMSASEFRIICILSFIIFPP